MEVEDSHVSIILDDSRGKSSSGPSRSLPSESECSPCFIRCLRTRRGRTPINQKWILPHVLVPQGRTCTAYISSGPWTGSAPVIRGGRRGVCGREVFAWCSTESPPGAEVKTSCGCSERNSLCSKGSGW